MILALITFIIAFTRIYLGVHSYNQVLVGLSLAYLLESLFNFF